MPSTDIALSFTIAWVSDLLQGGKGTQVQFDNIKLDTEQVLKKISKNGNSPSRKPRVSGSNSHINRRTKGRGFDPWVGKISWRRKWQPTPAFLPGEIPRTEEPGGLQSMGLERVRHNLATEQQ